MAVKSFGSLFGRLYLHVTNPKHLTGNFNAHLFGRIVLFGDEAFYARDKKHESLLKTIITEELLTIEAKGVDAEQSRNCIHLMLSSNEEWVVPVGADDRRFFILDVSAKEKENHSYFRDIAHQMDHGGREALLHYLLTLDLTDFNVRSVPKTAEHAKQKTHSMSDGDQWVVLLAQSRTLPAVVSDKMPNVAYSNQLDVLHRGLYDDARARVPGLRFASDIRLSQILKDDWVGAKKWSNGARRGWEFPPLATLRAKIEERYGPQDWGDEPAVWAVPPNPYAGYDDQKQMANGGGESVL